MTCLLFLYYTWKKGTPCMTAADICNSWWYGDKLLGSDGRCANFTHQLSSRFYRCLYLWWKTLGYRIIFKDFIQKSIRSRPVVTVRCVLFIAVCFLRHTATETRGFRCPSKFVGRRFRHWTDFRIKTTEIAFSYMKSNLRLRIHTWS